MSTGNIGDIHLTAVGVFIARVRNLVRDGIRKFRCAAG